MRYISIALSIGLVAVAGYFVIKGLYIAFDGASYDARIVGGDAYNYIIAGNRGTAMVVAGAASAVVAAVFAILAEYLPKATD